MEQIRLSPSEIRYVAHLGVDRVVNILEERQVPKWERNIEGAIAEYAAAKLLNLHFDYTLDTFHTQADLGNNIQIRSSKNRGASLQIKSDDPAEHIYVLAVGETPTFNFPGWATGKELQGGTAITEYGDGNLIALPQDKLHSIESLKKFIRDAKNTVTNLHSILPA